MRPFEASREQGDSVRGMSTETGATLWRQCLQRSEVPGGRGVRHAMQLSRTLAKRMMPPECVDGVASAMLRVCAPAVIAALVAQGMSLG